MSLWILLKTLHICVSILQILVLIGGGGDNEIINKKSKAKLGYASMSSPRLPCGTIELNQRKKHYGYCQDHTRPMFESINFKTAVVKNRKSTVVKLQAYYYKVWEYNVLKGEEFSCGELKSGVNLPKIQTFTLKSS